MHCFVKNIKCSYQQKIENSKMSFYFTQTLSFITWAVMFDRSFLSSVLNRLTPLFTMEVSSTVITAVSEFHGGLIFISPALALFKHVQSDVNSECWQFLLLLHWNMLTLSAGPLSKRLHRTLTPVWAGQAGLCQKQLCCFSRRRWMCVLFVCCRDCGRVSVLLCRVADWVITPAGIQWRGGCSLSFLCVNPVTDAFGQIGEWHEGAPFLSTY